MSDKLRTPSDLKDAMDDEFAWRKVELSALKTLTFSTQGVRQRDLTIRAAVTLLYAHWEGFIKNIGTMYVKFVAAQQLKHSELAKCFLAISISSMVQEVVASSKIKPSLDLVDFLRNELNSRSNIVWRSAVQTQANLSSSVLREIVLALGLDYSRFETKEKLLDEKLLKNRNNIAHGKQLVIGIEEYLEVHNVIFGMMQDFFNQIENAVAMDSFRRT